MNIKHILKIAAVVFVVSSAMNLFTPSSVDALKCEKGVLHADNNLCWNETENKVQTNDCPFRNANNKCISITYAGVPKNNDGSSINYKSITCDQGYEPHSDGYCYKPKYTSVAGPPISQANCKGDSKGNGNYEYVWVDNQCKAKHKTEYDGRREPLGYDSAQNEQEEKKEECKAKGGLVRTAQGNSSAGFECILSQKGCEDKGGKWDAAKKDCILPQNNKNGTSGGYTGKTENCGKAKTNLIKCSGEGVPAIAGVLKLILGVLTAIVGIAAVGGIVYAAILYASASDNSGQVSQAKNMIRDVAIGILLYGFMIGIINWLIPGGIIG